MKNRDNESGMGFVGWLILALVVLGLFGIGPCSEACSDCGPRPKIETE